MKKKSEFVNKDLFVLKHNREFIFQFKKSQYQCYEYIV